MVEAYLDRLNVSIDGAADLHNSIRGRKDVFDRATGGIELSRRAYAEAKGNAVD